jgi:alpha 1,2-mannosyltransferase
MKVAALLLSRFNEVIFLDSDNVALRDPTPLLSSPAYTSTGALLWADYWQSTAAPDVKEILGLDALPRGSHESGQMVVDKGRAWPGLLTAAYMNLEAPLYYELLTGFMGKGDKESFAFGLASARVPYAVAPTPVGSVGRPVTRCVLNQRACWTAYGGNTMVQAGDDGRPLFLHANLPPKWTLAREADLHPRARRWVTVQPGGGAFADLLASLGLPDVEAEVHASLAALRCAPFLPAYVAALASPGRMGPAASLPLGVPPSQLGAGVNQGMNFRSPYRWGLAGTYSSWAYLGAWDVVAHAAQHNVLALARRVGRAGAWVGGGYFRPF